MVWRKQTDSGIVHAITPDKQEEALRLFSSVIIVCAEALSWLGRGEDRLPVTLCMLSLHC